MTRADSYAKLKAERLRCVENLARELAGGSIADAKVAAGRAKLELLERLLMTLKPPLLKRLAPFILIGVATALMVSVLAIVNARFVAARLQIHSRALSLVTNERADLRGVSLVDSAMIDGATRFDSAQIPAINAGSLHALTLEAQRIDIQSLVIAAKSELDIERNASTLRLAAKGSPVELKLNVLGRTKVFGADDDAPPIVDKTFGFAEPFVATRDTNESQAKTGAEFSIVGRMDPMKSTVLRLQPESLMFIEHIVDSAADQPFASSILGGKISFSGLKRTFELEEGDVLQIEGLDAEAARFEIDGSIHSVVDGTADDITVKRGDRIESISPSLLEFLSENHLIALLWGAAAFLSGMLWMASRFVSR